ncbi:MAG TPA: reverse transcriptase domain-containing protein [Pyrinomonadaceae bacterium]
MLNVSEEMKHLHLLAKLERGNRFNRLWKNLIQPEWLAQAWEEIRSNRGSKTPGLDRKTGFDVDMQMIFELAAELEGDIESCYDSIPHGKLLKQIEKRIADGKVLQLVKRFLKAGYMEDWKYHVTHSGTAQGNIVSPLLSNIFLHQLDEFMVNELKAKVPQSAHERDARRNPHYQRLGARIRLRRRWLKEGKYVERHEEIARELKVFQQELKRTPFYDKDKRHPSKLVYSRYCDDFVILVAGNRQEAEGIKQLVKEKLASMGLRLSDEKTKVTHWTHKVKFLGYHLQGKRRNKGVGIKAILKIPTGKIRKVREAIKRVSGYYNIPEADAMVQISAIFRGWCNYYCFATAPARIFSKFASFAWWRYAHYLAHKQKTRIAKVLKQEKRAHRLLALSRHGRSRQTFQTTVGKRNLVLDIFAPQKKQIRDLNNQQDWRVDLRPVNRLNWQSGRSLATRLQALDRAEGVCERCRAKPVAHVHHTVPLRSKSFLARVMSDRAQRYTAEALCVECHLAAHEGSFSPRKQRSGWNAQCFESCSLRVGRAA